MKVAIGVIPPYETKHYLLRDKEKDIPQEALFKIGDMECVRESRYAREIEYMDAIDVVRIHARKYPECCVHLVNLASHQTDTDFGTRTKNDNWCPDCKSSYSGLSYCRCP